MNKKNITYLTLNLISLLIYENKHKHIRRNINKYIIRIDGINLHTNNLPSEIQIIINFKLLS